MPPENKKKSTATKIQELVVDDNDRKSKSLLLYQKFPYGIMDGLAGEFTNIYCSRLESPREFMYISFLTCLGNILAKSLTITTEIKPQPRLYVLLLGQSADDRKSTAIEKTVDFFQYALTNRADLLDQTQPDYEMRRFSMCWGVGSAEGLAKKLKKCNSLLLYYDEFKSFISKAKIQNSTLLQCVNSLFESNRYENQTSKSEILIENGYLSMLAASTLQTYEAAWDKSFVDIGFNNRLFIVPGTSQRKHPLPSKVPESDKDYLSEELYKIITFVKEYREIGISERALKLYSDWYMNRPKSIHARRLDTYALRFMGLIAVNKRAKSINENIANSAIELMDWQLEMRQFHDPIDADNTSAKMEERIRRVLFHKGAQEDRMLKQLTNAYRSGLWFYNIAKKNLVDSDEIALNRKSDRWELLQRERYEEDKDN